jgi:hypothetical protein
MSDAKIEIKVGEVSFAGEGTEKWLSEQLDKLIEKIPQLAKVQSPKHGEAGASGTGGGAGKGATTGHTITGTLAAFLKAKSATGNQVRRFLATAVWLHDQGNHEHLTTAEVVAALTAAKQKELTNASNCLNQNVTKGFCQKTTKNQFFVTEDGLADIE